MSTERAERWRVVLVVEDDSDGRALVRLAEAAGAAITVDWLPANGIGNIKRKASKLIALAKERVPRGRGCVAVLVDRDGKTASRDEPHRSIAAACREAGVSYLEAVESLEAWFIADPGVRSWLDLAPAPNTDSMRKPKRRLSRAFRRRTNRTYRRRAARVQVADHASGPEVVRSPSWRRALRELRACGVEIPAS